MSTDDDRTVRDLIREEVESRGLPARTATADLVKRIESEMPDQILGLSAGFMGMDLESTVEEAVDRALADPRIQKALNIPSN